MNTQKNTILATRRQITLAYALMLAAASAPSWAQGLPTPMVYADTSATGRTSSVDNEMLMDSEPMVYTATKTRERLSDAPAAVSVLTEADIRASGALTIPDLLRQIPGVDVFEQNASQQNVSIRGFSDLFANKLLVMVDGRSIYQDFYGTIFWNTEPLLLTQIARIEIVRGPGSALYGANAFGGVINIITKTPQERAKAGQAFTVLAARGEQNSTITELQYATSAPGGWAVNAAGGYHGSNGFGGRVPGQVRDSYEVPILNLDAERKAAHSDLRLSAGSSDAISDISAKDVITDGHWQTRYVNLNYQDTHSSAPWTATVYGNFFHVTGTQDFPGNPVISVQNRTWNAELQQQRALSSRHQLVYGLSDRLTELVSTVTGPTRNQTLWSAYVQDQYTIGPKTQLFSGVRLDHHSVYGTQVSPRISLVHHLPNAQTLRLTYATAFRAPTLVEEYLNATYSTGPGLTFQTLGSTSLRPERITSVEAAYRKEFARGSLGVTTFYNTLRDLIGYANTLYAPPPFPPGIPTQSMTVNLGGGRAYGGELEGEWRVSPSWKLLANYSYEHVTNGNGSPGNYAPQHKINLGAQMDDHERWSGSIMTHYVDATLDGDTIPTTTIPPYIRLDARLGYRVGSKDRPWTIGVSGTNLQGSGHREYPNVTNPLGSQPQSAILGRTIWLTLDNRQ